MRNDHTTALRRASALTALMAVPLVLLAVVLLGHGSVSASPDPFYWTDWTTGDFSSGFVGKGTITTPTATVTVTYTNPQGIAFFQPSGGTDYYQNGLFGSGGRNPATSPYTSGVVANIPTGTDIIALRYAGSQTLTFSEEIANPVFSYVSLNGNGYGFDQDFEILSFGDPSDGNDCGYWGCGTSYKNVVDLGGGNFEYQLLGTGEPHGTIRFLGAFDTLTWRSLSNEYWNGFTVGVQGTAAEILNQPPDCSNAAPSETSLWPPNHEFRSITVNGVTDPDGDTVAVTIESIFQDEPVDANGNGDGNTSPDGRGVGSGTAEVRAERAGTGNGRVYEVSFTAADGNGGSCSGTVVVGVPHDKKGTAVNDGVVYDSITS